MQGIISDAQKAANAINNVGSSSGGGGKNEEIVAPVTNSTTKTPPKTSYQEEAPKNQHTNTPSVADVKKLQEALNFLFKAGLTVDGKLGPATKSAIKNAQKTMYNAGNESMKSQDGLWGVLTRAAMVSYIDKKINNLLSYGDGAGIYRNVQKYEDVKKSLPKAFYAKGTTGTKKDEWAVTDEIGDELVMYATPQGTLSFMRAGSTVVPADITKELMDIGKVGLNGLMNAPSAIQGINLMTNVISKPEVNLSFDALVKAEHITEETLPAVKKLVTEELEKFSRNLNYSLRRVGAK